MEDNRDLCKALPAVDTGVGEKKERQSNMELLRLLAMLFVLMLQDFRLSRASGFHKQSLFHLSACGI